MGRDRELALIAGLLDEARAGRPGFVFFDGEPGIGKTRLLEELAGGVEERGWLLLEGRAAEFERDIPFGAFVDAFDSYLTSIVPRLRGLVGGDELEELGAVFPALRGAGAAGEPAPGPDARVRSYRAIAVLLEALAKAQPLALVLDDLHWADRGTVELLGHLLRRRAAGPVVVAGGFRSGQLDAALDGELEAASRAGGVARVRLQPLSRADAEPLLSGVADGERLFRESGGNPFYLGQLVRDPGAAAAGRAAPGPAGAVPPQVAIAIERELNALSPAGRALAEAAATAGEPFELDLAVAAAALEEAEALAALDELAARDLVRQGSAPREFRFRHPLVRAAIYAGVAPGTRLQAHARCAEALAARDAPAALRAHHVEHAARPGDSEAVALLAQAAAEAGDRAPASAVGWLRQALRLLPAETGPARRLELLLPLPGLLTSIGELDAARVATLEAIDLAPADDAALRVQLTAACAALEQATGRQGEAERRLALAREEAEDDDGPEAVALLVATTMGYGFSRSYREMPAWGKRAAEAGRGVASAPLRAASLAVCALAHAFSGDVEEGLRYQAEAAALIDGLDDEELAERLDAIGFLAGAELYLDLYPETAAHGARGVEIGRRTGRLPLAPTLVPCLGTATWVLGRVRESVDLFDEAVEVARVARLRQALAWGLLNISIPLELAGELERACEVSREGLEVALELDDSVIVSWAGMTVGSSLLESGDPERALAAMLENCGEDAGDIPGGWRLYTLEKMVRCAIQTDPAEAAAMARRGSEYAAAIKLPLAQNWSLRASAHVALAAGDGAEAARLAAESVRWAERSSARVDVARSRTLLGLGLERTGDLDQAREELRRAAAELDACGARLLRDQAERELRRLGGRVHRRSRPGDAGGDGLAGLTGRELEVARLVAGRRTNAEVAAELFLSEKTVESHLRNIFRKLGVGDRVEMARAVEAHDADGDGDGAPQRFRH